MKTSLGKKAKLIRQLKAGDAPRWKMEVNGYKFTIYYREGFWSYDDKPLRNLDFKVAARIERTLNRKIEKLLGFTGHKDVG